MILLNGSELKAFVEESFIESEINLNITDLSFRVFEFGSMGHEFHRAGILNPRSGGRVWCPEIPVGAERKRVVGMQEFLSERDCLFGRDSRIKPLLDNSGFRPGHGVKR